MFWPIINGRKNRNRNNTDVLPVLQTPVTITGDNGINKILFVVAGTWISNSPLTLTYQWTRNGVPIAGETGLTYTTVQLDDGFVIACIETADNIMGLVSYTSNSIFVSSSAEDDLYDSFFNGTNDHELVVLNSGGFDTNVNFTLETVFISSGGGNKTLVSKVDDSAGFNWRLWVDSAGAVVFSMINDGSAAPDNELRSNLSGWQDDPALQFPPAGSRVHVVITKDDTNRGVVPPFDSLSMYINGVHTSTIGLSGPFEHDLGTLVKIGNDSYPDIEKGGWLGTIGQVRWYNRAVSSDEVFDMDNSYSSLPASLQADVEFAHVYEPNMLFAVDLTGNGHNLNGITGSGGFAIPIFTYSVPNIVTQEFIAKPALLGNVDPLIDTTFVIDNPIPQLIHRQQSDFTFVCMFTSKNFLPASFAAMFHLSGATMRQIMTSQFLTTEDVFSSTVPTTDQLYSMVLTRERNWTRIILDGVQIAQDYDDSSFDNADRLAIAGRDNAVDEEDVIYKWHGILSGWYLADIGCSVAAAQDLFTAGKVQLRGAMPSWFNRKIIVGFDLHSENQSGIDASGLGNNTTDPRLANIDYVTSLDLSYIQSVVDSVRAQTIFMDDSSFLSFAPVVVDPDPEDPIPADGSIYNVGTGDFTMSMWAKFNGVGIGAVFWELDHATGGGYDNIQLKYDVGDTISCSFNTMTILSSDRLVGAKFNRGRYHHFAVTRVGGALTFYINGVPIDTTGYVTDMNTINGGVLTPEIGRANGDYTNYKYMTIGSSAADIDDLYNSGIPLDWSRASSTVRANTVHAMRMNSFDSSFYDLSGNDTGMFLAQNGSLPDFEIGDPLFTPDVTGIVKSTGSIQPSNDGLQTMMTYSGAYPAEQQWTNDTFVNHSIGCWFKDDTPTSGGEDTDGNANHFFSTANYEYSVGIVNGQVQVTMPLEQHTKRVAVNDGLWHHFMLTVEEGVEVKIYLDGALILTSPSIFVHTATEAYNKIGFGPTQNLFDAASISMVQFIFAPQVISAADVLAIGGQGHMESFANVGAPITGSFTAWFEGLFDLTDYTATRPDLVPSFGYNPVATGAPILLA